MNNAQGEFALPPRVLPWSGRILAAHAVVQSDMWARLRTVSACCTSSGSTAARR